jgi:glycosyltransferase involved in cell wall biosynthesis
MKILIVSQYFWPESFSINDVARSLLEKGVEVDVLTGKPNYPAGQKFAGYHGWGCMREIWNGVSLFRVPLAARGEGGGRRLAVNYLSFVISGMLFGAWVLRKRRYDAILVYAPSPILQAIPAIFLAWLKRCGVIVWVQDLWPESLSATGHVRNKTVLKMVESVVRFIYSRADLLLAQSRAFVPLVQTLASGTPVVYYPNSVDPSFASSPKQDLPEVTGLDGGFSVLFAGNIGTVQAVETIVEAADFLKPYPDVQLVVMGDGSRREWMLQEQGDRGLSNLHLPGRFPVEAMPGFMQKASVLLVTLTDQEIFKATIPNKIQAYLAAGRPIAASLNGEGANIVLEAGAGLAAPAEDGKALADTILRFYHMSEQEREAMGARGRAYYRKHFEHDMLITQLIEHLRSVSDLKEK